MTLTPGQVGNLGQVFPGNSLTTMVTGTSPAGPDTPGGNDVSTLHICNQAGAPDTITVAIIPSGGSLVSASYLLKGFSLAANGFQQLTGIVLGPGDVLKVQSANNTSSFNAFGSVNV